MSLRDARANWRGIAFHAAGITVLLLLAFSFIDLLGDSFWYAAVGRWTLEHGHFPTRDPFAFSAVSVPWLVPMPASQVIFAWVTGRFGESALLWMGSIVTTAALSLAWLGGARRLASRVAVFPSLLVTLWIVRGSLAARGQNFGDLAYVCLLLCITQARYVSTKAIPLIGATLGACWINLHSSALAGPVVVSAYGVVLFFDEGPTTTTRRLALLVGALSIGLLITPFGPALLGNVLQLSNAATTKSVDLFRPPQFSSPEFLLAAAFALLVIAGGQLRNRVREGRAESALVLFWLCASCFAMRHLEFLLLTTIFFGGRVLDRELNDSRHVNLARVGMTFAAVLGSVWLIATGALRKDPRAQVPSDAADFVLAHGLRENVLNPYHWGGFLDYAWYGKPRTFIDGRSQLFENGVFDDYSKIDRVDSEWPYLLDVYDIRTVLWEKGSALDFELSQLPDWDRVFSGRLAVVYVRRATAPKADHAL